MPGEKLDFAEEVGAEEGSRDQESERDRNGSKNKSGSGQAAAKTKDVSHVPCKFFRLNQCTAGSSCPFSHHLNEPGQIKDVCQWYLKNNCKFGHKCALAHILPGQPMSMDRKNKKAAQQAAQQAAGGTGKNERRKAGGSKEESLRVGLGRGLGKSAAPISISKATISPSAPAPALRDTDFSQGFPDEFDKPAEAKVQDQEENNGVALSPGGAASIEEKTPAPPPAPELAPSTSTSPNKKDIQQQETTLPVNKPLPSRGVHRLNGSGDFGFGPIGSPPRSSPAQTPNSKPIQPTVQRINGFSPSTSPNTGGMPSTSPFSAPGSKSLFMAYSLDRDTSASTQIQGTTTTSRATNFGGAMSLGGIRGWDITGSSALAGGDDDDLEEFLPSSLNELLTDEERKRRLSRTGGQRPMMETHLSQHRYSRSVPAASLMDNVKSLWHENNADIQGSGGPSPSLLGTSNVSTGFLPRRPAMNTGRAFSDLAATGNGLPASFSAAAGFGSPPVPSMYMNRTTSNPLTSTSSQQYGGLQQARPIPGVGEETSLFNGNPLSPTARALQEHAPGQSLPQGLAAGLSRLHVRPHIPLGTSMSPHQGLAMSGSPGTRAYGGLSATDYNVGGFSAVGATSPPGLSRDAYDRFTSFAPSRTGGIGTPAGAPVPASGAASGYRGRPLAHTLSSPLAGPAFTNDDDVVFVME
ncbi:hypothetical protein M422DRAFT_32993 [Sphaerobolus stellatus SS14]|uniref:C3H1-type domain-containing protein n=1 Tax=Sphaerobolus stellatus (strain SS14) TaxID=990650 RepID=A0A0C9U7K5_SPHS4|nr:hypothetical protein M422DRAFT_32993 [Sphaerobolus stellatus SS14]